MHYLITICTFNGLHKSNIKKKTKGEKVFVFYLFSKLKMNCKTILLCPTSNKWQMRRYQIYEKHFSTEPYNFLFVYVFKFLSVLAFCRWMSFVHYKGYHCIQGNDKKQVTQFSNHFLEVTMFMVALSRLKHYDEMLLLLFLLLWLSR